MSPERQKQVLASLYDSLFDAITYSPDGKDAAFEPSTTFLQMSKNQVLDPKDYGGMMSPLKPGGSLAKAKAFSDLVDAVPAPEVVWVDSGKSVSEVYTQIVDSANTDREIDPEQQKKYDKAYDYLNHVTIIEDVNGDKVEMPGPSPIAKAYEQNHAAYVTAIGGYRTAYNAYDLSKVADQHAWNAAQPGLQLTVDQTWNTWNNQGRAQVDQASNLLRATINDGVLNAITRAQDLVAPKSRLAPLTVGGQSWLASYAVPSNWMTSSAKATKLTIKSSSIKTSSSSEATSYAVSARGAYGLWHAQGSVSGNHQEQQAHMSAEEFELSAELLLVQIKRPWFNPLLLSMQDWWVSGVPADGVADGKVKGDPKRLMPLVPTGFVLARNVVIKADFSDEEKKFVADSIAAEATVGWGPFSVSGKYAHSSTDSEYSATFDGGKLELPGLQIVAWINSVMPASPPRSEPS